jgi:cytochrome c556
MENAMRRNAIVVLATVSAMLAGSAIAQTLEEEAIAYRKGVYTVIGWNFKPMSKMVKGETPYDKEGFARRAAIIAQMAPLVHEGFGPGTDKGAPTKAKAEIWTKMDDFKGKLNKMNEEATKLATMSKAATFDEVKKQFGVTAGTCKACHDEYKAKS